jgi:acyl dehydratase
MIQLSLEEYLQLPIDTILHQTNDIQVTQKDIDQFIECTGDDYHIHKKTIDNPIPIANGNLVLSKTGLMITFKSVRQVLHMGYTFVRYIYPVYSESLLKCVFKHKGIKQVNDTIYITTISSDVYNQSTNKLVCKFTYQLHHTLSST